ncbi:MAG: ATPase, T2SS/T4P/T4SS family [Elusimicrobia bacterium]|nr:ATPase, T2SS/T4P/T4SS family [Elusimicrobiota bacterium]
MEKSDAGVLHLELDAMFGEQPAGARASKAAPPPAAASPSRGKEPQKPLLKTYTILVVDDNKDYRDIVRHLLTVHHFNVVEAVDGSEALGIITKAPPDLALVDFNMPKMNGYELIQEVRSNYELRNMRIIMFTGASNRQHLKTLNMDISDFLEKPVPNAKLLESVKKALGMLQKPAPERPPAPPPKPVQPEEPLEPTPSSMVDLEIERFEMQEEQARHPVARPQETAQAQVELPREPISLPEPAPAAEPEIPPATVPAAEPEILPEPEEEAVEEVPEMDQVFTAEDTHEIEVIDSEAERKAEDQQMAGIEAIEKDSPLIQMVNKILVKAVELRASDIHMEPQENKVSVRVRVDGVLRQLTTLPIAIHPRVTARIKIMSNLVITERRIPQDGQFRVNIKGNRIEFRVSTLPCIKGEKIVMRVLGQSKLNSDLAKLALTPRELGCVEAALKSPHGLILVTGPTGSGKTTTLYTMINYLNKPDVNIMTAEDPVEYEVPNVNQVKIMPAVGLTFESTLRAFLRQDPDIMLVGEIRDLETAEIAIKASITGHLVFSTLHTNNAPATVVRLTHMGVAPFLVAASVKMVIAQRLVRTLCPRCKRPTKLSEDDARFLTGEERALLKTVYHAPGCASCQHSGYTGRRALFEVMPVESSAMRQLITTSFNVDQLSDLAAQEGMTTLRQAALAAVAGGVTSMTEALKIMMG